MKLLVTGADGQVGSDIVKYATSSGFQIDQTNIETLDITNHKNVYNYVLSSQPDLIINAAAYTLVDQAENEKENAFSINRDGPTNLANVCSNLNIPLFHISTDYVFNGEKREPYIETDFPDPLGVYGKSKLEGDIAVQKMEKFIILRVAWVFGEHGNNFVKTMLRLGTERNDLDIVGDQIGGPTWSGDIAKTLIFIAQKYVNHDSIPWGLYHYTGEPELSWFEFAKEIFNVADSLGVITKKPNLRSINANEYQTLAQRPINSCLNCNKIFQMLGIPQPDWNKGLRQVLKTWDS